MKNNKLLFAILSLILISLLLIIILINFGKITFTKSRAGDYTENKVGITKVEASNTQKGYPVTNVYDGKSNTVWISGKKPSQFILIDLGEARLLSKTRVLISQIPAKGDVKYNIYLGNKPSSLKYDNVFEGDVVSGNWIDIPVSDSNQKFRYVKIESVKGQSIVAFAEVEVYEKVMTGYKTAGWDDGIYKKCATTYTGYGSNRVNQPSLSKPYEVVDDCSADISLQSTPKWLVSFHSESNYGLSGQCQNSFEINGQNSPIKMNWSRQPDGHYWVQLFSDYSSLGHPCDGGAYNNGGYFNWFVLQQQNDTSYYPKPFSRILTKYKMWYDSFLPNGTTSGGSRVIAVWNGYWKDKEGKLKSRNIEVALYKEGWGDAYPNDPRVIATYNNDDVNFVFVDGSYYGYSLQKTVDTTLEIDWNKIIDDLIKNKYLVEPEDRNNSVTTGVGLGVETNNKSKKGSIITNLWIKDITVLTDK